MIEQIVTTHGHKNNQYANLDIDNCRIEVGRFFDANHQNERGDHDGQEAEQVKSAELMRQACNINLARLHLGHQQVCRLPMVLIEDEFIPARTGE